jgi:hypothetical protein
MSDKLRAVATAMFAGLDYPPVPSCGSFRVHTVQRPWSMEEFAASLPAASPPLCALLDYDFGSAVPSALQSPGVVAGCSWPGAFADFEASRLDHTRALLSDLGVVVQRKAIPGGLASPDPPSLPPVALLVSRTPPWDLCPSVLRHRPDGLELPRRRRLFDVMRLSSKCLPTARTAMVLTGRLRLASRPLCTRCRLWPGWCRGLW